MPELKSILARRRGAFLADMAGGVSIVVLFAAALYLPALV